MADELDDLDWELAKLGRAVWIEVVDGGLRSIWLLNTLKRRLDTEEVEDYVQTQTTDVRCPFWFFEVGSAVCDEANENPWFAERVAALFQTHSSEPWLRKFLHLRAKVIPFKKPYS